MSEERVEYVVEPASKKVKQPLDRAVGITFVLMAGLIVLAVIMGCTYLGSLWIGGGG